MKKIIAILIISLGIVSVATAQDDFDAVRYGGSDINGTARYMSMAGAFGALGGDASSIGLNPAGLGVYRKSELSLSLGLGTNSAKSTWEGQSATDNSFFVSPNNFTFVWSFVNRSKTEGFIGSNFAITYNKLKNYNRNTSIATDKLASSLTDFMVNEAYGFSAQDLSEFSHTAFDLAVLGRKTDLIYIPDGETEWTSFNTSDKPNIRYNLREKGSLDEWGFSYGANINHKFYFGLSLGVQTLSYSTESRYTEDFPNGGFDLYNNCQVKGTGINVKAGVIFKPINALRLGLAFHSPTLMGLTSYYNGTLDAAYSEYDENDVLINYGGKVKTLDGNVGYQLQGAWQGNASAAVILGKRGLLSFDYGLTDFASSRIRDKNTYSLNKFSDANSAIRKNLKPVHSFRIGAELNATDRFAVRLGYSYVTSPFAKNATKEVYYIDDTSPEYSFDSDAHSFSTGFGVKAGIWFFDFAYLLKYQKQEFYPYDFGTVKSAQIANLTHNVAATVGLRF